MKKYQISKDKETHICPNCTNDLSTVIGVDKEGYPNEGDIMVCNMCGEILTFNSDLTFKKITNKKLKEIKIRSLDEFNMIIKLSDHFKNRFNKK
jgi:transcription elongation factor Elf1